MRIFHFRRHFRTYTGVSFDVWLRPELIIQSESSTIRKVNPDSSPEVGIGPAKSAQCVKFHLFKNSWR